MPKYIEYFVELRKRLIRCLLMTTIVFVIFAIEANHIFHTLALPLLQHLPAQAGLIATTITAVFLVPYKCAFLFAIYVTAPYWFYEIGMFIAPALYRHEKNMIWKLLLLSCALFYVGTLFAYFVVLPGLLKFFMHTTPIGVSLMPEISHYLSFVVQIVVAFGIAFELPIVLLVLMGLQIFSVQQLRVKRPYVIVGAFVVGMLLTPPDVLSQTMLAIPLWFLYELGLVMAKWLLPTVNTAVNNQVR